MGPNVQQVQMQLHVSECQEHPPDCTVIGFNCGPVAQFVHLPPDGVRFIHQLLGRRALTLDVPRIIVAPGGVVPPGTVKG